MQSNWARALAASFILVASPGFCQPMEFKGVAIGQTSAELGKALPGIRCEPLASRFRLLGDARCALPTVAQCGRIKELTRWRECLALAEPVATIAGVQTIAVDLWLVDDKLARISIDIAPNDFDTVAAAVAQKYGQPVDDRSFPIRTMAGVEHLNRSITWKHPDGTIGGQRFGLDVTRGTVVFRSSAAAQRADKATPTVAERAKDL